MRREASTYRLSFSVYVVVNYDYVPPSAVNGRIPYQYVLRIGEHMYLYIVVGGYAGYRGRKRVLTVPDLNIIRVAHIYILALTFILGGGLQNL